MPRLLSVLFVLGASIPVVASADSTDEDRKRIEGTWRVVSLTVNGDKTKDEDAKKITVVNGDDGTWSVRLDGKEISKGTSTFDPTKMPKTINFTATEGGGIGNKYLGIYELTDKTRKLCFSQPGQKRPRQFSSRPDSQHILVTFERLKTPGE